MGSQTRRRREALKVWVTHEEKVEIVENADQVGLSISKYLRNLGLQFRPKSVVDSKAILELIRLRADLGRVGGLLKLWLVKDPKVAEIDQGSFKIHRTLRDIEKVVEEIETVVKNI